LQTDKQTSTETVNDAYRHVWIINVRSMLTTKWRGARMGFSRTLIRWSACGPLLELQDAEGESQGELSWRFVGVVLCVCTYLFNRAYKKLSYSRDSARCRWRWL